jgi:hypothetical protein
MSAASHIIRHLLEDEEGDFDFKDAATDPTPEELRQYQRDAAAAQLQADLAVARNPQTPPEVLARLLNHEHAGVVLAAIKNPRTPTMAVINALHDFLEKTGRSRRDLPQRLMIATGSGEKQRLKRLAREALGAGNGVPVSIVLNSQRPPRWAGKGYGWESPGGSEWRGSSAPGWPYYRTYAYRPSTRRIVVGASWPGFTTSMDYAI